MARKAPTVETLYLKYDEVLRASAEESPMIQVIVSAALTEKALIRLLSNFFIEGHTAENILSEKGALSDFSKCADAAYCLGLITDGMLENLKRIGSIRNLFAHAHEFLDFDDRDVMALCSQLTGQKGWHLPMKGGQGVPIAGHLKTLSARKRFTWVCSGTCADLIRKAVKVKRRDKLKDTWSKPRPS